MSAIGDAAVFEWSAPHDNEPDEPVHHYEIRYAYTLGFQPPAFWDLSTPVLDPPTPASPGSRQVYAFVDLNKGRDLWVGIRSYDSAGNQSEGSDLVVIHIPGLQMTARCVDVMTGAPIEGLDVRLASGAAIDLITNAHGEFMVDELLPGGMSIEIKKGSSGTDYHRLSQVFIIADDTTHTFVMIPYQSTIHPDLSGISLLRFFRQLTNTEDTDGLLAKWHTYPVPVYVPPFVNENGVDYEAISKAAVQRWVDKTGSPLFTLVDSKPDTGIVVAYRDSASIAPNIGITKHLIDVDDHPILDEIRILDNFPDSDSALDFLYKVMLHEFGHTIRFIHISSCNAQCWAFIMYGQQPLPDDISEDEVNAVTLHQALPTRIDMSIYDDSDPNLAQ